MTDEVVHVSAPARLHLGFLDPGAHWGRRFGGIGLALEEPETRLAIARSDSLRVTGPEAKRIEAHLCVMRDRLALAGTYRIDCQSAIPAHTGLGSGTQLALALACGLRKLEGLPLDIEGDAAALGRGKRSGLGASFLTRGGLAVDGGKGEEDSPPPVVARFDFPEDWRVILAFERDAAGIHGEAEIEAFATLPRFSREAAGEISALTLMQVLPGVAEADINLFGQGVARIQALVGSHFAPAQGGVFASSRVAQCMECLADLGAHGIGQSSWGPTGFAFAPDETSAKTLVARAAERGATQGLDLQIVRGRNGGAAIERREAEPVPVRRSRTG
ncbi:beta-RFAP synthase [Fulvimarina manganoxydans]|uniref:Beta-RFAP synthase n=1 Tax=Fulvimarina manganoxydans TaxID=937218 RepID=A0A1W2DHV0_9HYPH|nr:beta-ribofuranosylaminobenzene 5'-phosphate synthase family protein [Fulvimarina manganoxydans]SMC97067.1 beta-RFAP synthase [Fulvimarina manganoxydans]